MSAVVLRGPVLPPRLSAAVLSRRHARIRRLSRRVAASGDADADGEPPRERKNAPAWPLTLWETAYLSWLGARAAAHAAATAHATRALR